MSFYQRQCHGCGQPCDGYYCESCIVRGGLCLPCDLREKDLYNYDPNAYSFDNSNYIPQSQYENYLCNLCGDNSHDGYDCQQQFLFVYEHGPSYNQNYDDNYYPHESPSFPCCDYCGGSHETFQCQPDNQNVDFPKLLKYLKELTEYDQSTSTDRPIFLNDNEDYPVQNRESPENSSEENVEPQQDSDIHKLIDECCKEVPEEQKQNMEKTMLDLVKICHHKQFLFMHDNVDDLIESALDSKLLSINSINSQRLNKKEQEVKIIEEQPAERRNRIEKSLQNVRVIHKSSISLNTSQISSIHEVAPILSTKEPENSLSMGYEHLSITPKTESNAKNLLPIPSECEVTSEDKRECDELICENSSTIVVCDNHSEILFDSNNDDFSSDDESFEDIEYVDASVPNPAIVSVEEENVVQREDITRLISNIESLNDNSTLDRVLNSFESDNSLLDNFLPEFETFFDNSEETRSGNTTHANYSLLEYDSFRVEIGPGQERLINLVENDIPDNSSNDPLLEEVDLFLSDNLIPPGIENFADDPEEDIHFLEELLINDSILSHEPFDSSFEDSPSISRPPPKPPDDNFDLEPEVISAVMEDIDEPDEHFNPGGEIFFLQTMKMLITFLSCLLSDSFFHISSFLRFLRYYSLLRVRTQSLILLEVISAVMEDIDEPDEHFNPEGEIFVSTNNKDVDYFPFMFVIRIFLPYLILPEISPLFLSAESEDTLFDPGISD
nr:hypothetical protein [Tanacetum cinerariifolium]